MQITAQEITTVVSAVVTIATFIVGHVLHYKKTAAKIAAIGATVEQNAPQIAQVETGVMSVANDLTK
jgi:hypothetical protein